MTRRQSQHKNSSAQQKNGPTQNPNKPAHKKSRPEAGGQKPAQATAPVVARRPPSDKRADELIPLILEVKANEDYALLDSGDGLKLERYGPLKIVRPEAQAIWQKALEPKEWKAVDAIFTGDTEEDGMGRWLFPSGQLGETWPMEWDGITFHGRFTSFRHVGVFPEQSSHWHFLSDMVREAAKKRSTPPKVLNLFGYTGLASLAAARAGAHVTHVDASKKAIGWARENQQLADMENLPIRWICDDAVKFCERELRRGNTYDAILLDPPKYGRGPKGEVWQLLDDLPHMVDLTRELISKDPLFVVLTSYAIRSSFYAMHEIMQEAFGDLGGKIESGELILRTEDSARAISTSLFSRWIA